MTSLTATEAGMIYIEEEVFEYCRSIDREVDLGMKLNAIHVQLRVLESCDYVTTISHDTTGGRSFNHGVSMGQQHLT